MNVQNAQTLPKVYFGLHMVEGIAEYREPDQEPYRILVNESTIKQMDPTFQGRPVYVKHVEEVDLKNLQARADGYVVRSFFNQADGKHWCEFLVVSDEGHRAIASGWRLSNAYIPKAFGSGGLWHGAEYQKEVTEGEYEHLAIVPNPRYDESVILTPEQFKTYNETKELELKRLANSKGEKSVLNIFKKTKVDNSADLENMSVVLPKSKVERTISQLVNDADAMMAPDHMANGDHHVMVGEEKMKVNDLIKKHMELKDSYGKLCANMEVQPGEGESGKSVEKKESEELSAEAKKANEEKEMEDKKKNDELDAEKKQNDLEVAAAKKANFDKLMNADKKAPANQNVVDLDKAARGKSRYGSGK